jgi:hypothetical protein
MEWHENIEAADAVTKDLVDVSNIVAGLERVLTVRTSKGCLIFRKASSMKIAELAGQYAEILNKATETSSAAMTAMSKEIPERTQEDWAAMQVFNQAGLPWSIALSHASLVRPTMTREVFEEFLFSLPEADQKQVLETVSGIYMPSAEVKGVVKRVAEVSARFGIPLSDKLTMQNCPADLFLILDEVNKEEKEAIKNALGR